MNEAYASKSLDIFNEKCLEYGMKDNIVNKEIYNKVQNVKMYQNEQQGQGQQRSTLNFKQQQLDGDSHTVTDVAVGADGLVLQGGLNKKPGEGGHTFAVPQARASVLGLDKLAMEKRIEREAKERENALRLQQQQQDDDNGNGNDKDNNGDSNTSFHKVKKHYREIHAQTPTHSGGVNRDALDRIEERNRDRDRDRDRRGITYSSRDNNNYHRNDDRRDNNRDWDRDRDRDRNDRERDHNDRDRNDRDRDRYRDNREQSERSRPRDDRGGYTPSRRNESSSSSTPYRDGRNDRDGSVRRDGGRNDSSRQFDTPSRREHDTPSRRGGGDYPNNNNTNPNATPQRHGGVHRDSSSKPYPRSKYETPQRRGQNDDDRDDFKGTGGVQDNSNRRKYDEDDEEFDRDYYDADEGEGAVHDQRDGGPFLGDEAKFKKMEEEMQKRQSRRMSTKAKQKNEDNSRWEANRMMQSGIMVQKELDLDFTEEEEDRINLIVSNSVPKFLEGTAAAAASSQRAVMTVKDATSDLAIISKKGSILLRDYRDKKDRIKGQKKVWELGGTALGNIMGMKKESDDDNPEIKQGEAEVVDDKTGDVVNYKSNSQYASHLKKAEATSEFGRTKTIKQQREYLPVYGCRNELMRIIAENNVVIIVGETGSGKTTQLTQYLYEEGYAAFGKIGCTQPRRVAAMSVAKRVAEEMGVTLGEQVGYAIRFEDCTTKDTAIKYMTDGVLLKESLNDANLDKYSAIIMDEAHERSLNTDVLFGILRKVLTRRHDLKLIVTSATMDAKKFAMFFGDVPIFNIPGRTFPVDVLWSKTPCEDFVDAAVKQALSIHVTHPEGDILIFMTGQEDIECTCATIEERMKQLGTDAPPLLLLPIYSQLPSDLQAKIFDAAEKGTRKCIVATNIAETSLTVDGIKYVIDTGYSKLKVYNPRVGMDALQVTPISKANANQRSGRAGRTGPGRAYRMYTESAFKNEMLDNNIPEIQRTNLGNVVLNLKSIGVKDLLDFDFMDPPPADNILNSMFQLWVLGALADDGGITSLGRKMVEFPLDPPLSKMVLFSVTKGCAQEIVTIVSMLSIPTVFFRPKGAEEESDAAREKFFVPESDHLTLLHVYQQWKINNYSAQWCNEHFIHVKAMRKVREVRGQLMEIMETQKLPVESCGTDWDVVRKAICSSYFHHSAKIKGIGEYVNMRTGMPCFLHPTSALYGLGYAPDYIVYHELVMTTKEYMQIVTAVDPKWLAELGPMFFTIKESFKQRAARKKRQKEMGEGGEDDEEDDDDEAEQSDDTDQLEKLVSGKPTQQRRSSKYQRLTFEEQKTTPKAAAPIAMPGSVRGNTPGGATPRRTPSRFGL
ncbi:hypothetical protein SAMD00019534_110910 [Acytostelium subglobosum LB1]|uniref:hypothetical protein n=1 Tax=Acytostelium subglobosum LB1 TaxID=1410327 RepID=UPI0006451BAC|nr:hypothetical protein SAMD00019534_110910 [Acytostelium subglobosum LB1]GAM27915.1 hypothetical protein SAMD00019534_110910 [Acytostelium subglobosum LB1]|eukprot:XP_012749198.1 hypothetical protein SAMD00019534_110910 [Acytostelium subglobosum LB1]